VRARAAQRLGYLALLRRVACERGKTVYAPTYDRTIGQPVPGAIAVEPAARVVLTEGNYLLDESEPWGNVRKVLTEVWCCDLPDDVRRQRLVDRHVRFGEVLRSRATVGRRGRPAERRTHRGARRLADLVVHA